MKGAEKSMNVEKLASGKYKFREKYKCPLTNKWKSVTITYEKNNRHIEKLAQRELNKKIDTILSGNINNNIDVTVGSMIKLYLEDVKNVLKEDSTYPHRIRVMKEIQSLLGKDTKVSNITSLYINKTLPHNHLRTYSKILFKWAYRSELTDKDISLFIKKDLKKKKTLQEVINQDCDERQYYTREELTNLFNTLSTSKSYYPKMLSLILEAQTILGKRFGEVIALYEDDIDEQEQIAHIYKRIYNGSVNTPKNKKSIDDIGINKRMIQIKKESVFIKKMYGIESRYLFTTKHGEPYRYDTARAILKRYGYKSNTHIFRKTCASLLAEQGVPLKYIQDRLGHEDDKMTTDIYIQVTEKMKKDQQDYFKNLNIF